MKLSPGVLIVMIWALLITHPPASAQTQQEQYLAKVMKDLKPEDVSARYASYDFSGLIIPEQKFIGYIGPDYERIRIIYTSVERDKNDKGKYLVKGVSIVSNNSCDFSGTMRVTGIHELKSMQLGVDSIYKNPGFRAQGIMIAEYKFREDPRGPHPGIFEGSMFVSWLVTSKGKLRPNHVHSHSDSFRDNQHAGTWTAYGSENPQRCNWGIRRIPFAGDLDIGTA